MWTKRILILLPVLICAFLVQSYFWVPTYETQARANPNRRYQYINASIGDAQILNPALNADTASSSICDKVFEGLIDRDENLSFRGRLATSWEISEEAYFVAHKGGGKTAVELVRLVKAAMAEHKGKNTPLGRCVANITGVETAPPETFTHKDKDRLPAKEGQEPTSGENEKKP